LVLIFFYRCLLSFITTTQEDQHNADRWSSCWLSQAAQERPCLSVTAQFVQRKLAAYEAADRVL
jgi:hypothetical protein